VLRYMDQNWSKSEWCRFFLMPDKLNPHDLWVLQLLYGARTDN